jgi:hypothetical protein
MTDMRLLPLLFVLDDAGTPAIRCLCGAEGASVRRGVAHQMTRLRAAPPATLLSPDTGDLGALRMVLHARTCERGQALLAAGRNPLTEATPAAAPPLPVAGQTPAAGVRQQPGRGNTPAAGSQPSTASQGILCGP